MPTYDYRCEACGHTLEIFHSMSEAPKKKCPKCAKSKLVRQIGGGSGILFKGSGFHQTDYRSEAYKQSAAAESKAASSVDSKVANKADCSGPCAGGTGACASTPSNN